MIKSSDGRSEMQHGRILNALNNLRILYFRRAAQHLKQLSFRKASFFYDSALNFRADQLQLSAILLVTVAAMVMRQSVG